ncbi:hypothetical protein CBR_g51967 [Chara braunii]|uniref:Uncharacterized protein n=1 Tax=Chara braunii TaxID=69332 RepID=A0A388K6K1_CHABU|nr:hypothetical protein CBR_g51967 [Chara braunii]|eukprot:GBG65667.1 hypothetical protein CBR_g51967 [Chara braunii]
MNNALPIVLGEEGITEGPTIGKGRGTNYGWPGISNRRMVAMAVHMEKIMIVRELSIAADRKRAEKGSPLDGRGGVNGSMGESSKPLQVGLQQRPHGCSTCLEEDKRNRAEQSIVHHIRQDESGEWRWQPLDGRGAK